jgi:hypothetical protein
VPGGRRSDLNESAFVSLVYNAALLLVLVFVYDLIARYLRHQSLSFKLLTGLVLGVISIAVMLAAWRLSSGVIFDTRSVVLSMGTLFYGTIPGLARRSRRISRRSPLGASATSSPICWSTPRSTNAASSSRARSTRTRPRSDCSRRRVVRNS